MTPSLPAITDLHSLMRGIGRWVRNTRYTLGLSQDQLASLANTSQGAISRLEAGRSLDTPLMTYVKAIGALCREIEPFGQTVPIAPYVRDALAFAAYFDPKGDLPPVISDPTFAAFMVRYGTMSVATRQVFLNLTAPLVEYLLWEEVPEEKTAV